VFALNDMKLFEMLINLIWLNPLNIYSTSKGYLVHVLDTKNKQQKNPLQMKTTWEFLPQAVCFLWRKKWLYKVHPTNNVHSHQTVISQNWETFSGCLYTAMLYSLYNYTQADKMCHLSSRRQLQLLAPSNQIKKELNKN